MNLLEEAKKYGFKAIWFAEDGEIFISIEVGANETRHIENLPVSQPAAEGWMRKVLRQANNGRAANKNEVDTFRNELISIAFEQQFRTETFLRVAEHEGNLYVDLGRADWAIVKITPEGYAVTYQVPVAAFRRSLSTHPLPIPQGGGSLDQLKDYINLQSQEDFLLLCSWLISTYHPTGDYVHLFLTGDFGAAKSTTARFLQQLIHPSSSSTKAPPKDESALMIEAYHNRVVMIDNENHLTGFLPNALCRLSTGSGHSARELYTNRSQVAFSVSRPCVVTSHVLPTDQKDLLSRSLHIELSPPKKIITRGRLKEGFDKVHPFIIGAIFDVLSAILKNRKIYNENGFILPRMSDAAYWIICGAEEIGWQSPDQFLEAFKDNQSRMRTKGNQGTDPLIDLLIKKMAERDVWEDTPENILKELQAPPTIRGLPKAANVLSRKLNSLQGRLMPLGLLVETGLHAKSGISRLLRITKNHAFYDQSSGIDIPESE